MRGYGKFGALLTGEIEEYKVSRRVFIGQLAQRFNRSV